MSANKVIRLHSLHACILIDLNTNQTTVNQLTGYKRSVSLNIKKKTSYPSAALKTINERWFFS